MTEDELLEGITDSMDMNLGKQKTKVNMDFGGKQARISCLPTIRL